LQVNAESSKEVISIIKGVYKLKLNFLQLLNETKSQILFLLSLSDCLHQDSEGCE